MATKFSDLSKAPKGECIITSLSSFIVRWSVRKINRFEALHGKTHIGDTVSAVVRRTYRGVKYEDYVTRIWKNFCKQ